MTIKLGINGFGRIGRNVLRSAVQNAVVLGMETTRTAIFCVARISCARSASWTSEPVAMITA